ncbi:hypothetical protein [Aliikangiella coralliicola]|uniref:Uncharacterized protein n=1 Tax=Aliikangiella coralliicola TaxID=2592383 RepID=A0A545UG63_9GAMM|nr:hypothetical protein [Aliikangiella coralliicola]TQV88466.1 hypothetical protein FLL46_08045 [Aliikangiella coralliicola]
MVSPLMMKKSHELLIEANKRIEKLELQRRELALELQYLAQEAREQKSIVLEIYQALGLKRTDNNDAKPIIRLFKYLNAQIGYEPIGEAKA